MKRASWWAMGVLVLAGCASTAPRSDRDVRGEDAEVAVDGDDAEVAVDGDDADVAMDRMSEEDQARTRVRCNPEGESCLLYTSPSPRDRTRSRMPSSA